MPVAAETEPARCAIVVEGGAMRGIFHAGVLDAFLEREFHPFDLAIGVSAGACNLASHLAGQHQRNLRVYTGPMCDRRFIRLPRLVTGGHAMDLEWLWEHLQVHDVLDAEAAITHPTQYVVAATSWDSGQPVYLEPDAGQLGDCLKGSCAVPLLYRGPAMTCGGPVVDGGVGDPILVREAYRRGARRILVVRTRPTDYRKSLGIESRIGSWLHRHQPGLAAAILRVPDVYGDALAFMASPPADCEILQVAPEEPLESGRTTQEVPKLQRDYALGLQQGKLAVDAFGR